jgi:hypothetical protein
LGHLSNHARIVKGGGAGADQPGMSLATLAARTAALALTLAALLAGPATAGAAVSPTDGTSANRIAKVCAQRTARSSRPPVRAAERRAATRRCVRKMTQATISRRRSSDVTAPTVAWQSPAAGATVKGTLEGSTCLMTAADDRGVSRIVISVDGNVLETEKYAPYECWLDTTKLADGSHTLAATAYDAAGNSRTATAAVTVSNAAAPAPAPEPAQAPASGSLVVGIDGGWGGWSSTETTYRAQLGAAVTRHEWDPTEPVTAQEALVLKAASQVKTRIHALLGGNVLGDPTRYREWVVAFIRRYGVGGSFWAEHPELDASRYAMTTFELGNEPYFGDMSASLYADTVRPTLEEVKRLGLPAKIVLPTRAYGSDTSWMDTLYLRIPNLNSYAYAFAEHPYWYGHDPAQVSAAGPFGRIHTTRRRMNEKGASDKPIYITEYGESTASCGSECVTEAVQAEHVKAMVNAAITRTEWKIEMVSVFQLLDRGTGSSNRELQFGLLRQNGTPKPSYSIVRERIQQYRG